MSRVGEKLELATTTRKRKGTSCKQRRKVLYDQSKATSTDHAIIDAEAEGDLNIEKLPVLILSKKTFPSVFRTLLRRRE